MKNKTDSRLGRMFARIIHVRAWLDWARIKSWTRYLVEGCKKFFIPQKVTTKESFEKAVTRLNLSDNELLQRQQGLLRLSILMVSIAALLFIYTIYLLATGGYLGAFLGVVVTLIALTLAFRYHFWYFQIKQRKLGCTLRQWYRQGLMGEKK